MNSLALTGLVVRHPAAALASFGLYKIVPGCKLSFRPHAGSHVPVLHSSIKTVEQLADVICDKETWAWINDFPNTIVQKTNKKGKETTGEETQLSLKAFLTMAEQCPDLAVAVATDHRYREEGDKKKRKQKEAGDDQKEKEKGLDRTPFYMFGRQSARFRVQMKLMLDHTLANRPYVVTTLTNHRWELVVGAGNQGGMFPENAAEKVFANVVPEPVKTEGITKLVPFIALMAVGAWRLFPCYHDGVRATAVGWRENNFLFPVFSEPLSESVFAALMAYPAMTAKDMAAFGVRAVYSCGRVDRTGKGVFNFTMASIL